MSWAELSHLLRYDVVDGAGAVTVRLAGELDLLSSPQLVELIERVGRRTPRVVVDLSRVSFLDARGLSQLLLGDRSLRDQGGELVLRRPHRAVRRLLQLSAGSVAIPVEEPGAWLGPTPDIAAICGEAVDAAIWISGATAAEAQLADAAGALRIVAARGTPQSVRDFFEVVDDTESASGVAWATGKAVYVPDVTRSAIFLETPSLEVVCDAGLRSGAAIPLTGAQGRLVGMLSVQSGRTGRLTRAQRRQLQALAGATSRLLADEAC